MYNFDPVVVLRALMGARDFIQFFFFLSFFLSFATSFFFFLISVELFFLFFLKMKHFT